MAIISFKCPNCGGELIFDPATQKYKCEYCNSLFAQEELDAMKPMQGEEPEAAAQERQHKRQPGQRQVRRQRPGRQWESGKANRRARRCITAVRPAAQRL